MEVAARDKDRDASSDRVYPVFVRQWRSRPGLLIPAAAFHPAARLRGPGSVCDAEHKLVRPGAASQIYRLQRKTAGEKMRVRVDESRQYRSAVQIHDFHPGHFPVRQVANVPVRAYRAQPAVLGDQRLCMGQGGVECVNVGIYEDQRSVCIVWHQNIPPDSWL